MRIAWIGAVLLGLAWLPACGGGGGGGGGTPDPGAGGSTPTELATGATFQDAGGTGTGWALGKLVADASNLYWFEYDGSMGLSGGRIRTVPQAGGTVQVLASGLGGVNGLASDATHLYWTEFDLSSGLGPLKRVPVGGGAVETLSTGHFFPVGPALSGTTVYWGDRQGFGSILQRPKAGGSTTPLVAGTMGMTYAPDVMTADATTLYWFESTGGNGYSVPLAGGAASVLATGLNNPRCPSVDGDTLYFMEMAVPRILYRMPKTGGSRSMVEAMGVTNLVSDGTNMFWARQDAQTGTKVVRLPKAGGSETVLGFGGGLGVLNSIVVSGGMVFLLDVGANQTGMGRILKL